MKSGKLVGNNESCPANRRVFTYLSYAILFLFGMAFTVMGPLLSEIAVSFSLNMAQVGFLFTANFIGFTGFIILGGIAADRFGKKIVVAIAIIGLTITLVFFPISPTFIVASIIIMFIGGFFGFIDSIVNALIVDLNTENPGFYINLAQVFVGIGALISPIIAGIMISKGLPWQSVYYILACLFFIISVIFMIIKFPSTPNQESISWIGFKGLITDKKFILIFICMFLYMGAEVSGWGWMSSFLKQNSDFSVLSSSAAVSVFWTAIVIGRIIFSLLILKYSIRVLIVFLAFSSVLVTTLSGFMDNRFAIWIIIIAMGLAYSGQWAMIISYGNENYKKNTGTVFALLAGGGGLGAALLPFLIGIIGQYISIRSAMIILALPFLVIGLTFLFIDKIHARQF